MPVRAHTRVKERINKWNKLKFLFLPLESIKIKKKNLKIELS